MLSIINFALAAPVAVRERPEVRLDVSVTRNVKAVSQKRWDPEDGELPLPMVPGYHPPPPSPDLSEILSEIQYAHNSPIPDSPASESSFGYALPNLDHTQAPSPELTEILSQIPSADRPPPTLDTGSLSGSAVPSPGHLQPPSPGLESLLSQISYSELPTPNSPGSLPESDYESVPSPSHVPRPHPGSPDVWSQVTQLVEQLDTPPPTPESMPVAGSDSPPPPPPPHPSQSGPSEDRFQGRPAHSGLPIPQSWVDPINSVLAPENLPPGFWEFLKGKIKRRMSGSDTVDLAKKDRRSRIFSP